MGMMEYNLRKKCGYVALNFPTSDSPQKNPTLTFKARKKCNIYCIIADDGNNNIGKSESN